MAAALAFCLSAAAQPALHRLRVFENPSLTIFSIAEGPDGLLWLAAADGLYRFDGFHYHKITSYPFPTARFVAFTGDGALWCGDFEGLCRVVRNRFQITIADDIAAMAAYPDQVFARLAASMVRVGLDGTVRPVPYVPRRDLTIDALGRLWFICLDMKQICWVDPSHVDSVHSLSFSPDFDQYQAAANAQGLVWSADDEQAVPVEGRQPVRLQRLHSRHGARSGPLLAGRNGQLWFLGETVRGLSPAMEFRDSKDQERFPPLSGFEDSRGHLWVASAGQGLTEWIPEPSWQRWFPQDFGGEATAQMVRDRRGNAFVATDKHIYREDAQSGKWVRMTHEDQRYYFLFPLDDGGFLASIRGVGLARLAPDGGIVERFPNPPELPMDHRQIVRDGKGRIWIGAKRALFRLEGQPGSLRLREELLPQLGAHDLVQAVALRVDGSGRLWVGYTRGIAWLDDADRWHVLDTDQPADWVRSFTFAGDDIWVAHRRQGAYSRLHRNGQRWRVTPFLATAGYAPVSTNFLVRDSRGWIWRGSSDGVHVSDGRNLGVNDWLHLYPGNGLAANETGQYGFFEDHDGSVWIAGDEGLSHLRPSPAWFDAPHNAPPPRVTRVEADGRVLLFPDTPPAALPAATRVLKIDVGALQASPFRERPLRYRLLPLSKEWFLTRDGSLEFRNLPDKSYSLEVGYIGNGESAVGVWDFRIGAGGGLGWGWLVGLVLAGGAMAPAALHAPRVARTRFRMEKALFLMRRRAQYRKLQPGAADTTENEGQVMLGRYRLERMVSRGGFAVVYEARDLKDPTARLAVKVLNRARGQESWVRDRFAHEVAALRSVEHPGVVRILDSWITAAGEPCLAMPFLDGATLRAALDAGPLGLERVARISRQLGSALAAVHAHGIVHRDLKPENLILVQAGDGTEQAVIIDFGTAGLRTAEHELAATTLMSGSFHYMAPERLTGHYSAASDVFSLAVVVLEMLTRKRLADLQAMFFEPAFGEELEKTLAAAVGMNTGKALANLLGPAYDPEPRRRPADVEVWAEKVAEAIS
jgi:serine/threonine-protein kinase